MDGNVYKLIELTGTSKTSVEDAIQNAIGRASKTLHNLSWFQVTETRGSIREGKASEFQVTLKVGFRLDE
jgi:flavin-binding protein dodecin